MSKENKGVKQEIDAGEFFTKLFLILVGVGFIFGFIWYVIKVYNPKEKAIMRKTHWAYNTLIKEMNEMYEKKGYIFNPEDENDMEFCKTLAEKYSKNKTGSCINTDNLMPQENFVFDKKKIAIYGLEKPLINVFGTYVKDIIIDTDTVEKGDNLIGSDKIILRIYSSGRTPNRITPVNCSSQDETDYDMKRSSLCSGGVEANFLLAKKPLAFGILYKDPETKEERLITRNTSFLEADCRSSDGDTLVIDDYCSQKMLNLFRKCEDAGNCKIVLTK